jgi:hypothetical protein
MHVVTTLLKILKIWNLKFLKLIQSIFQILKLSKVLNHMQIGRNVHDIQNKVAVYDSRNKKSKVVSIFWYDSKYDKFSNSSAKFTHFEIFIFIQQ